ncbi:tail fiber domain-containing protein [Patescibacteria group bacterium]|nr:tail fiber domain-containing protein [Patescibacteria group bacterium]MBU4162239.1 tail fiber domain-containing protein [Patescibacteria group bacterium]
MKKENQISPKIISLSFVVFVLLAITTFYIFAWTEPTTAPPGGNVAVPINTGGDSQYKTGKLGASASGVDPSYGLTIGSSGIKATGNSYFEGALTVTTDITANDDIIFNGELMPDGSTCANNQILQKIGADNWDCVNMPSGGTLSGSGTANYVSKWTAGTTLGNSQIFDNGTNVGIGTTGPDNKLEVRNGAIEIEYDNQDSKLRFHDPNNVWYSMGIDVSDGGKFKINYGGNIGDNSHITMMTNGNVGIGTTGPGEKLQVAGGMFWLTGLTENTANINGLGFWGGDNGGGIYARGTTGAGSLNIFNTAGSIYLATTGNVGIGTTAPVQRLTVAGQIAINDNNTRIYEGGGNAVRIQTNSGYIDIGPQNTSYAHIYTDRTSGFYFNEELRAPAFYYSSDVTLKDNIKPLENSLERILQLQGVSFNWKSGREYSIGLIAQDVEKIFPELVSEVDGLKSIEYGKLVAPLIESIKEQQKEIEELRLEIEKLKK